MQPSQQRELSAAAKTVLEDFKTQAYHQDIPGFLSVCVKVINTVDIRIVKELGASSFAAFAPVFAPWYNPKSEWFGHYVWNGNTDAFSQRLLLKCTDKDWQIPQSQQTEHSLKAKFNPSLNRKDMGQNVSESQEKQSFSQVKQQIENIIESKMRNQYIASDTDSLMAKRKSKQQQSSSKSLKKKKKKKVLQLSEQSLVALENMKPKIGKMKNRREIAELNQYDQIRQIKIRIFPDKKFIHKFNEWLDLKYQMVNFIINILNDSRDQGEKVSIQALRNQVALSQVKAKKCRVPDDDPRLRWMRMPSTVQDEIINATRTYYYAAHEKYTKGDIKDYNFMPKRDDDQFQMLQFQAKDARVDPDSNRVRLLPSFLKSFGKLYAKDPLFQAPGKIDYWPRFIKFGYGRGRAFKIVKRNKKFFVIVSYDASCIQGPFTDWYFQQLQDMNNADDNLEGARSFISRRDARCRQTGNSCSVDPGVRVSMTVFDLDRRSFIAIAPDFKQLYKKRSEQISNAQSLKDQMDNRAAAFQNGQLSLEEFKAQKKELWHTWKQSKNNVVPTDIGISRAYTKFSAYVSNLHNRIGNFLMRHYDLIILPEFLTSKMVKKRRKRLNLPPVVSDTANVLVTHSRGQQNSGHILHKNTRKTLLAFSHYKCRMKLIAMAQANIFRSGKQVLVTTEEFTSKQHPFQNVLHNCLGADEYFMLGDFRAYRDNVGSYNVMSRSFSKEEVKLVTANQEDQTLYKEFVTSI
ncbi:hypothetical protein MIR68_002933 [Amoeboaphelidium protococcarum]|nr:hypothetical protein MIR68_002933 [Amoeboaphelidium protococcarum]